MSSYVTQYQSRGVGAIATHDLRTTRAAGELTLSPEQVFEAAEKPALTPRPPSEGPTLSARVRRGSPSDSFTPGRTGHPIIPVSTPVTIHSTPLVSHPGYGTTEAGLIPGRPSGTLTAAEDDRQEAEFLVPDIPEKDNTKWWILGGVAALWLLTRKR